MSRADDRDGPDPRRSTGGSSVLLVVLLVGGVFALLLVVAVVGAGFFVLARTAEVEHVEMRMVMEEEQARLEKEKAQVEKEEAAKTRIYLRADFKTLVEGKTEQEVEDALGKPARIEQHGPTSHWYYEKRTVGVAIDPSVKVTFELGRVTAVTY